MRKRHVAITLGTVAALLAAIAPASGELIGTDVSRQDPDTEKVYDVRHKADPVRPNREQLTAVAELATDAGGARVTWDPRFGTPRTIRASGRALSDPRDGSAAQVAKAWVQAHRTALGLSEAGVAALAVTRDHKLPKSSARVVQFAQVADEVPSVRGGRLSVTVDGDGRVWSYSGSTARSTGVAGEWELSAPDAMEAVAETLAPDADYTPEIRGQRAGYDVVAKGPFAADSYLKKVVFPTADGMVPAYRVLFVEALFEGYDTVVDARDGSILYRRSLVHDASEGTVYENYPGADKGGQPVTESFGPNDQSPSGWVDPSGIAGLPGPTTLGNNANSYANYSNFLVPADQGPRPVSPTSQFDYDFKNHWGTSKGQTTPPSYAQDMEPATTNLFYHHNRIHDEFRSLGFTESAGNFQTNNGDKGGEDGDAIMGLVHAGALTGGAPTYTGRDNAYMLTLPDGLPSWSGMFLWEPINDAFEGPYADGNFDASVIEHEYAHGLSNRYVSAEDGALGTHQSGSMGEGWGDWYALNYLHREGLDDRSVVGAYVTGNDDRGIRNWNYDENPTGFGDIGYDTVGAEVHADGEIWTTILWHIRKALVDKFGAAEGGDIAQRIVTDAMPLSPPDPSFIDMRDAILSALDIRYGSRSDHEAITDIVWTGFARRGLGLHASSDTGKDIDPVPSFTHADQDRNGMLTGTVVNASTDKPVPNAKVMIGEFEARVSPLRTSGDDGQFAADVVGGTYPVTVAAPGFGSRTFQNVEVTPGKATGLKFSIGPNLASKANGAAIVSAGTKGAERLIDDTEGSSWRADKGSGDAVIELAAEAEVDSVQVSAYTTSRFQALRSFTVQTSTDLQNWTTALTKKDAFGYQAPRPVVPDLHYKTFELTKPVNAKYVRFTADDAMGETKDQVQTAEVQVFSKNAKGVEPLPPTPPDDPVTDKGSIKAGNPGASATQAEFEEACSAPPASQGADGWVSTLPDSFGDGAHKVAVDGKGSAEPYDLDLYFYDADCEQLGSAASSAADESGTLPSGTKYVVTHLWLGAAVDFTLTATDTA